MKIGIIGSENSHTAAIAHIINIEKQIKGCSVDYVWGETKQLAEQAAKNGQITNIVSTPAEMLGKVDAVIVDHRHPKYHLKAVWPFVEQGIPTFVDKPFCYRSSEGKAFLRMARRKGTPVTSFSVLPHQASFRRFQKKLASLGTIFSATSCGPADVRSRWGGVFFYGIHQVDMILNAFGYDVTAALVTQNGSNVAAQLIYSKDLVVNIALIKEGCPEFFLSAVGTKGTIHMPILGDKDVYLSGVKAFTTMFKTGKEPLTHEQILRPVQVLEALERSLES